MHFFVVFISSGVFLAMGPLESEAMAVDSGDALAPIAVESRHVGQFRDDEETDESSSFKPLPLIPVLANLLGATLGANDKQVNRTIDRFTLTNNGIDPDASTTTEEPTKQEVVESTTKDDGDGEDEEENGEDGDARRRKERREISNLKR